MPSVRILLGDDDGRPTSPMVGGSHPLQPREIVSVGLTRHDLNRCGADFERGGLGGEDAMLSVVVRDVS